MVKIKSVIPFAGLALTACGPSAAERPNVIYVFPDQYRNSSLGFWSDPEFASQVAWQGDPVSTPNLDRFAREAVVLSEAVSNFPVSSPHRGMLLSGMYPERNGVVLNCMSERPVSTLPVDAECIGVVFQVGQHANDRSDYSQTGIGEAACHGYVVALQDASEELCLWGVYGYEIGLYPVDDSGNKIDNFTNNGGDTDWSGYLYTEKITLEAERNGGFTPDTQEGYPVGYYTRQFAQAVPAPANSSGWFIPAVSQLCTVYGLREQLDAREGMTRLRNRWYWSSSECYALADGSINCLDVSTGMVGYRGKFDAIGLIRPILAF